MLLLHQRRAATAQWRAHPDGLKASRPTLLSHRRRRLTPPAAADDDDADALPPAAASLPPPAAPAALDAAAALAVDRFVRPGAVVGLGRGEMVQRAVAAIGARIKDGRLGNVSVVASAAPAAAAAAFHGVPVSPTTAAASPSPVVFFDEADQVDLAANAYLSGSRAGEAAHPDLPTIRTLVERTLERGGEVVALLPSAAACVPRLNAALPIAIAGASSSAASSDAAANNDQADTGGDAAAASSSSFAAWEETAEELDDIFLGDAELWRRPQDPQESANPRGGRSPLIQPDGTTIVDARFYEGLTLFGDGEAEYGAILEEVDGVEGVVATGLFVGKATAAVVPPAGEAVAPRVFLRKGGAGLVADE